jgi:energy-converting hydrogenase B subunit D
MNLVLILNTLIIIAIIVAAVCAVAFENNLSSVIALAIVGTLMAVEFILLQAPDVAIAEAAVGAVLSTIIYVIAIRKTTSKEDEEK